MNKRSTITKLLLFTFVLVLVFPVDSYGKTYRSAENNIKTFIQSSEPVYTSTQDRSTIFEGNDILMYYPPDWDNIDVAGKVHANVIGSPHDDSFTAFNNSDGMLHVVKITTDVRFEDLKGKEAILNINGNPMGAWMPPRDRILCSIHYPGFKERLISLAKEYVDRGADVLAIDNMALNCNYIFDNDGGDFSQYSLVGFQKYLVWKYGSVELKRRGITDISRFNYAEFIRKKYMKSYNGNRMDIPFFSDFSDFQLKSCKEMWRDLINQTREYAQKKGRRIFFSNNVNSFTSEMACSTLVDGLMTEFEYAFPPRDNITPFLKLYQGMGKQAALVDNCGFCTEILSRPDITELMKIYTGQAYAAGGFNYVPYASFCLNEKKEFQFYYQDLEKLYPYYDFIYGNSSYYENREAVSPIGLYYSFPTLKKEYFNAINGTFQGVSNLLLDAHRQYEVIFGADGEWIEDSLTLKNFTKYSSIIIPNACNMSDKHLNLILEYVKNGGNAVVFGNLGQYNEKGAKVSRPQLTSLCKNGIHKYGRGQFIYISEDIGSRYNSRREESILKTFITTLDKCSMPAVVTNAGRNTEIQCYYNNKNNAEIVHLVNCDYDIKKMKFNPQGPIKIQLPVDGRMAGKVLEVVFDSPDEKSPISVNYRINKNVLEFQVPKLYTYGVVYIGEKGQLNALKAVEGLKNCCNELRAYIDVGESDKVVEEGERLIGEGKYSASAELALGELNKLEKNYNNKNIENARILMKLWQDKGRVLDYQAIVAILNEAEKLFTQGKYHESSQKISTVEDMMGFKIDGSISDWNGIKPLQVDNREPVSARGPNMKEIYVTNDNKYIYFCLKISNYSTEKTPSVNFCIDLNMDDEYEYEVVCEPGTIQDGGKRFGRINDIRNRPPKILPYNFSVETGDYYEVRFPLEFLGDAKDINVRVNAFNFINGNGYEGNELRFNYRMN